MTAERRVVADAVFLRKLRVCGIYRCEKHPGGCRKTYLTLGLRSPGLLSPSIWHPTSGGFSMRSAAPCAARRWCFNSIASQILLLGALGFAQSPPPKTAPASAINSSSAQQPAPPENTAPSIGDASQPAAAA